MLNIEKEKLRKEYKVIRNSVENRKEKSKEIAEKIKQIDKYKNANVIAIYKSFSSEVDTTEIIRNALMANKLVCIPKIIDDKMQFYKITKNSKLTKNKFGIEEPESNIENFIEKKNIDMAIIPGLCFDKEKNRLGFGKGYYDKYLEDSKIITIGVCFEEQILKNRLLPTNEFDIKMNYLITDKQIIK